jgi:phospholipid:diacylglycerol acyltransferase
VWGNTTWAADDPPNAWQTHGQFVAFRPSSGVHDPGLRNLTADEASNFILEHTPSTFQVVFPPSSLMVPHLQLVRG